MNRAKLPWKPRSWRDRPVSQQPDYDDPVRLDGVLAEIRSGAPLVSAEECAALRQACASAAAGKAFIIQAGECAESLASDPVAESDMANELFAALDDAVRGETVRIARIAGQFAKPRSEPFETQDGLKLPAYRGDAVNGLPFDSEARRHDPARLAAAYRHSATTIGNLRRIGSPVFTSHEALILPYEEALVFEDGEGRWWSGSSHMLWIGDRTRQVDGAHVAFASGIENVVGVKCGPSLGVDELLRLAEKLDPERMPGKLLLIGRFGANRIKSCLPPLLRAARREGLVAGWIIDSMHGNTRHVGGRKHRRIADLVEEVRAFFAICVSEGVEAAGVHLEVAMGRVAECIDIDGHDPMADFPCDPRLNSDQAVELVKLADACRRQIAHA